VPIRPGQTARDKPAQGKARPAQPVQRRPGFPTPHQPGEPQRGETTAAAWHPAAKCHAPLSHPVGAQLSLRVISYPRRRLAGFARLTCPGLACLRPSAPLRRCGKKQAQQKRDNLQALESRVNTDFSSPQPRLGVMNTRYYADTSMKPISTPTFPHPRAKRG